MAKDPICGMTVNEKDSLRVTHHGNTYFFCSKSCMNKFAEKNGISTHGTISCSTNQKKSIYKNKNFIVILILLSTIFLSYLVPLLEPFRIALWEYFKIIWWAILLGFFLGGVIDHYVPREYISHLLAQPKKKTIFYSVFLGFLMSTCSHGILALAIQLHKKGASNAAVVAFLLASPWANVAVTIMLIGFFGMKALYIVFSAIIIAINTGLIFQLLERKNIIEKNTNQLEYDKDFSIKKDIRSRLKKYRLSWQSLRNDMKGVYRGAMSLSNMVLWWILIGMGIASLAGAYVPSHIFQNYMSASVGGLFVTLLVATVIEVCSEGSAPMAFEIFRQTRAIGNSLVFLMAGVATDYTEIGLLWHNVGKKTAIWLPIITVPQIIVLGWIANIIFK
ncbi:MAG: permease [Candidatus Omnitrophica bacterium]|nr:permease [Candidatus Omnitrophota bacterium]